MSERLNKQSRPRVADWLDTDYPRKTYWNRDEAIAWIAERTDKAVGLVGEASRLPDWKAVGNLYCLLVEGALLRNYEVGQTHNDGTREVVPAFDDAVAVEHSLGRDGTLKRLFVDWPRPSSNELSPAPPTIGVRLKWATTEFDGALAAGQLLVRGTVPSEATK